MDHGFKLGSRLDWKVVGTFQGSYKLWSTARYISHLGLTRQNPKDIISTKI